MNKGILLLGFFSCVIAGGLLMYALSRYYPTLTAWQELLGYLAIGAAVGLGVYRLCVKPALARQKQP